MRNIASFILLVFVGVILPSLALPDVIDDALIHLGSGDYILRKVRHATHNNNHRELSKWFRELKKYRVFVEDSKNALLHYRPRTDSIMERLRNLLSSHIHSLIERMEGFLREAPDPRDDQDIEAEIGT